MREISKWVTIGGRHIPIFKGEGVKQNMANFRKQQELKNGSSQRMTKFIEEATGLRKGKVVAEMNTGRGSLRQYRGNAHNLREGDFVVKREDNGMGKKFFHIYYTSYRHDGVEAKIKDAFKSIGVKEKDTHTYYSGGNYNILEVFRK